MILYHGTRKEYANAILKNGFDIDAIRRSDPGDIGWGIYLTDSISRAKSYGSVVLKVDLDVSDFAHIPNPYFLNGWEEVKPVTKLEKLFYSIAFDSEHTMLTLHRRAKTREEVSKDISIAFLETGYDGIITSPNRMNQIEAVVFNPSVIESVSLL